MDVNESRSRRVSFVSIDLKTNFLTRGFLRKLFERQDIPLHFRINCIAVQAAHVAVNK